MTTLWPVASASSIAGITRAASSTAELAEEALLRTFEARARRRRAAR
jgi:hypothetical protein